MSDDREREELFAVCRAALLQLGLEQIAADLSEDEWRVFAREFERATERAVERATPRRRKLFRP